jgi:hypothetical protein
MSSEVGHCECTDADCMEIVRCDIVQCEDIRRHRRRFFVVLGHEAPLIATGSAVLVDGFANHSVIELIGRAGQLAEDDHDEDWG